MSTAACKYAGKLLKACCASCALGLAPHALRLIWTKGKRLQLKTRCKEIMYFLCFARLDCAGNVVFTSRHKCLAVNVCVAIQMCHRSEYKKRKNLKKKKNLHGDCCARAVFFALLWGLMGRGDDMNFRRHSAICLTQN